MATLQEIIDLESGAGRSSREVQNLIQRLRQDLRDAQIRDKQFAKNIESTGKAGLKGIKTRRDYLLAIRENPELSFKDFLLDDKTSAKYMEQGVDRITNKTRKPITLKEVLGFDKSRYQGNPIAKQEFDEMMKIAPISTLQEEFIPEDVNVPEFNVDKILEESNYGNFISPPVAKPAPLNQNIMQGVQPPKTLQEMKIEHLNKYGKLPENPIIGYNKPENLEFITRQNPQMLEEVLVAPTPALDANKAIESASTATDSASAAADFASTDSAAGKLGTAGAAIGAVSSLKDLGTKGLSPSTAMNTAGSGMTLASKTIPGAQVLALPGMALKFLSGILGKYN
tara:strand:+ start:4937 stop:5956 length:1020 start_codon:yes stop_codon:yes gene_type:complete